MREYRIHIVWIYEIHNVLSLDDMGSIGIFRSGDDKPIILNQLQGFIYWLTKETECATISICVVLQQHKLLVVLCIFGR